MLSVKEYHQYSRGYYGEEFWDFAFFRPLAYFFVKITYRLPLTPNLFSLAGLVTALWASVEIARGTKEGFLIGAVGILLFSIFDCCDGLLARMKKNSSPLGELIDMIVDLISSIGYYTGAYLGFQKYQGEQWYHPLILFAGGFIFLHATIYHYYKKVYQFYQNGNPEGRDREIEKYKRELSKLKSNELHKRFLIRFYLIFARLQSNPNKQLKFERQSYLEYNRPILPLWGMIAGSTHLVVLSLALILARIEYYLYFAYIVANVWMIFIFTIQSGINKNLGMKE